MAAIAAALACWLSSSVLAFLGSAGTARIGVLPADPIHLSIAAAVGIVVLAIGLTGGRGVSVLIAVSPLALVFLPWLPMPVPAAFLMWSGALAALVWCAVVIGLIAVVLRADDQYWTFYASSRGTAGRAAAIAAGVLGALVFSTAAWFASPSIPGGDEPHYLVITQSLLYDHDLKIENNHRRGDYHAYFAGDLRPDFVRRGRNGEIYSIHAPGVSALVLPAFAIGGYHAVVVFLILLASAACGLAWWLAWRVSGSFAGAWFGWAAVTLTAPFLLETYTVYPDGPGAAIVLTGFWALVRASDETDDPLHPSSASPWFLHGLALATLPWLHTRFAALAATIGGLVLVRLARTANPLGKAIAFLAAPAISAIAWMFFFAVIYGTPDPSAPYGGTIQSSLAYLPNGLGGVLFDQGFGLFAAAPVLVVAFAGFAAARRFALEWIVIAVPYLVAVTTFAMWWAGMSGPARFLIPLVLPLAIPAACAWTRATSRGWRAVMLALLVASVWMAAVMAGAGGGHLGYHTRNEAGMTAAPWLEWASAAVDLASGAPAFVPLPVGSALEARMAAAAAGFGATAIWAMCAGGAAFTLAWWLNRKRRPRQHAVAAAALLFGCAGMLAATLVWTVHGAHAVTPAPAQLDALRALAVPRAIAVDVRRLRRVSSAEMAAMTIEIPVRAIGRTVPRGNRPLAAFPAVPPGIYDLSVRARAGAEGWVMAGVGNDQFALATQPVGAFEQGVRLSLPAGARTLSIRADEDAREDLEAVDLHPVAPVAAPFSTALARHAVHYASAVVFFLDDRAFPEPSGFWIGGARATEIVVAPAQPSATVALLLRNAPVANTVTLESGSWRQALTLNPGEERHVDLPIDAAARAALVQIASSAGFRPSEHDPSSRDTRFLGVYMKIE